MQLDESLRVGILLATYQGERYIDEQIQSIIGQTYKNWMLFIRDDGSCDGTESRIEKYLDDARIVFIEKSDGKRGAKENFSRILSEVVENQKLDVYMFSDQDDVWLPDKIAYSVDQYHRLLMKCEHDNTPVLLHSDLLVVDSELNVISETFCGYQHINAVDGSKLNALLVQNCVTGCTVLFNRALAKLAAPIPDNAVWHDWWLGLLASSAGVCRFMPRSLVKYRQSDTNTLGAKKYKYRSEYSLRDIYRRFDAVNQHMESARMQAMDLLRRLEERQVPVTPATRSILYAFIEQFGCSLFGRISKSIRYRFGRPGVVGKIKYLLRIMLLPMSVSRSRHV